MKIDKRMFKKSPEEFQEYLKFKRRGSVVESKKVKVLLRGKRNILICLCSSVGRAED